MPVALFFVFPNRDDEVCLSREPLLLLFLLPMSIWELLLR